jgi:four helix bundle protein
MTSNLNLKVKAVSDHPAFQDLIVLQRAVELSLAIYKMTESFPPSERFGLTNQLRRASVSVASNIAEGYGRSTRGEYVLFLGHARGSNCEVQTQLVIAKGLGFGSEGDCDGAERLANQIGRMLVAMISKLRR